MDLDKKERQMRILVVDDFTNMRRTIKNMLRQIGFDHIDEADDGDTALEKIEVANYDFLICDWNMPRMPGINLLREIRAHDRLKNIPFLMVTAENWEEEIIEAAEERVDGYIIKPFVTKTLEDKIQEILQKRKNPSEGEKLYQQGLDNLDRKMFKEAAGNFESILKIKTNSAKATHMLGLVALEQGEMDKAEELFKSAIGYNKRYVKGYHSLAEVYIKKDDISAAISNLEQAVAISPRISHRQLLLGQLLLKEKKFQNSIEALKKGIELAFKPDQAKNQIKEWIASLQDSEKELFIKGLSLDSSLETEQK